MDHYAVHHNWIVSNHNWWANTVPETVRFYHVWFHGCQVVFCLAYIYNATAGHCVDTSQKETRRSGFWLFLLRGISYPRRRLGGQCEQFVVCVYGFSSFYIVADERQILTTILSVDPKSPPSETY